MEYLIFNKVLKGVRLAKSDDTLGRSLGRVDITDLQKINAAVVKKARENKVFQGGNIGGYLVVAIDGTEVYLSPVERLGFKVREHKSKDGNKKKEYYQQIVSVAYVGKGSRLILGIERVEPGEGEVTAAKRLLERIHRQQKRGFGEIIVADALYAGVPFINAVLEMHKDVVIKVKQENREIIRDAEGLFKKRMPDLQKEALTIREGDEDGKDIRYEVEIHDAEGFTSWEEVNQPLRVLRIKETLIKPDKSREEKPVYYLVTTAPKSSISAEVIWRINHRRWDIENSGFNDLKQNWHFEHCFSHDPQAMVAIWTLLVVAFNLVLLFLYRQKAHNSHSA